MPVPGKDDLPPPFLYAATIAMQAKAIFGKKRLFILVDWSTKIMDNRSMCGFAGLGNNFQEDKGT